MRNLIMFSLLFLLFSLSTFAAEQISMQPKTQEWINQFHFYSTNPNIIYLLILIAIYGIFFELANPGSIVPGVTGAIAFIFVLYAFHLIPVNYLGVMLILFGIGFMIAEVFITSFGIIGLGGVIAFIIGSILLFNTQETSQQIAWPLIICMSVISFTFIFIIFSLAIKSHKRAIVSGREGLMDSEGIVLSVMNKQIVVRVMGEIWEAKSSYLLNPDDKIKVIHVDGLTLTVEPLEKKKGE